ncbi:hypothetical protein ACJMK2_028890 [Sinanodonta woodiana]|uniref:Uncharacterized protein n=1 Tax=Sinanodonta woodiana TaxID=1069815 RepID=A0ABD3X9Z5_SINWO
MSYIPYKTTTDINKVVEGQLSLSPNSTVKVKLCDGKFRTRQKLRSGHDKIVAKSSENRSIAARRRLQDKIYNRSPISFDDRDEFIQHLMFKGFPNIVIEDCNKTYFIDNTTMYLDNTKPAVKIIVHDVNHSTIEAISPQQLQELQDQFSSLKPNRIESIELEDDRSALKNSMS